MIASLEGHTAPVFSAEFVASGQLLISASEDKTIRIWRVRDGAAVAVLPCPLGISRVVGVQGAAVAYQDSAGDVHVWEFDEAALVGLKASWTSRYRNAKVILMGDSGVGKTGLALVLTGKPWEPTESTHGRRVWTFATEVVSLTGDSTEKREALLWDMAGQPGYRLVHQLHLNEVAVALVIFDARSEIDPMAGVRYWDRALRQARRLSPVISSTPSKFLVVARCDRGGVSIDPARLNELASLMGYQQVFVTSAKEGWQIPELIEAIREAIIWESLPWVGSNVLFERLKNFLVEEKKKGRVIATYEDLFRDFTRENPDVAAPSVLPEHSIPALGLSSTAI